MSGVGSAMSAAPLLLGTERIRIAANPGFGLHKAAAVLATFRLSIEEWTRLAGIVALLADLSRHFAVANCLTRRPEEPLGHLLDGRI